jgi:hypothetical protein
MLRVLDGEFSSTSGLASQLASVPCEPKLEITANPKLLRNPKREELRKDVPLDFLLDRSYSLSLAL